MKDNPALRDEIEKKVKDKLGVGAPLPIDSVAIDIEADAKALEAALAKEKSSL